MQKNKKIIIICGPTASGKSFLAQVLANDFNGEIINSDSMQIYSNISIITDSPSVKSKLKIPHHLYNFLSIKKEFSVIKYIMKAMTIIKQIISKKNIIIVGGTGLYINRLIYGYSDIPEISNETLKYTLELQRNLGQIEFFKSLNSLDPLVKFNINASDVQRSIRAFSVFMQTGHSIFEFQKRQKIFPLKGYSTKIFFLNPERNFLYNRCDTRIKDLFKNGAIEEIECLMNNFSDLEINKIKAIGVDEIRSFLTNKISLDDALKKTQIRTRQYAKRQITWFKNQINNKNTITYNDHYDFIESTKKLKNLLQDQEK